MGGQGQAPIAQGLPTLSQPQGTQRAVHRLDGECQAATTAGYIARADATEVGGQTHATEEGQERVLEVERRRRKVLEQTTSQVKGLGTLCKGHDRQQGQSQHGSGAGGADVPLKMALLGLPARAEDEL